MPDTPGHTRASGSLALPNFPWSTESTGEELDANPFQRAISTSLLQQKPISIHSTNRLSKNRACRLAWIQRSFLGWFLSCATALMQPIVAFYRPQRATWEPPAPADAVDSVYRVRSSFPWSVLGSLGESGCRAAEEWKRAE